MIFWHSNWKKTVHCTEYITTDCCQSWPKVCIQAVSGSPMQISHSGFWFLLLLSVFLDLRVEHTPDDSSPFTSFLGLPQYRAYHSFNISPVSAVMLFIHNVFGLPLARFPGRVNIVMSFSRLSCFLMVCHSKVSFLFFIASKRYLLIPAFSSTHWFVHLAVHDIRRMHRSPNISKALILSSSRLFNVQLSHPYVIALHANVFSRQTFVDILTPWLFQMVFGLPNCNKRTFHNN